MECNAKLRYTPSTNVASLSSNSTIPFEKENTEKKKKHKKKQSIFHYSIDRSCECVRCHGAYKLKSMGFWAVMTRRRQLYYTTCHQSRVHEDCWNIPAVSRSANQRMTLLSFALPIGDLGVNAAFLYNWRGMAYKMRAQLLCNAMVSGRFFLLSIHWKIKHTWVSACLASLPASVALRPTIERAARHHNRPITRRHVESMQYQLVGS